MDGIRYRGDRRPAHHMRDHDCWLVGYPARGKAARRRFTRSAASFTRISKARFRPFPTSARKKRFFLGIVLVGHRLYGRFIQAGLLAANFSSRDVAGEVLNVGNVVERVEDEIDDRARSHERKPIWHTCFLQPAQDVEAREPAVNIGWPRALNSCAQS